MFILALETLKDTLWEGYVFYAQPLSLSRAICLSVFVSRALARSLYSANSLSFSCALSLTRAQERARVHSLAHACLLCLCLFISRALARSLLHARSLFFSCALSHAPRAGAFFFSRACFVCVSLSLPRARTLSLFVLRTCALFSLSLSLFLSLSLSLSLYIYIISVFLTM